MAANSALLWSDQIKACSVEKIIEAKDAWIEFSLAKLSTVTTDNTHSDDILGYGVFGVNILSIFCFLQLKLSDVGDKLRVVSIFNKDSDLLSSDLPPLKFNDETKVHFHGLDPRIKTFAYRVVTPSSVNGQHHWLMLQPVLLKMLYSR